MEDPIETNDMEQTPADALDAEIQTLRNEIDLLSKRRDVLTSVLLSSDQVHSMSDGSDGKSEDHHSLGDMITKHEAQTRLNSRRSLLTTTLFSMKDPDPCASSTENVYGVRIERFSHQQKKFLTPAYIFMQRTNSSPEAGKDLWRVHRHTLPACIPIQALASMYLPEPPSEDDGNAKQLRRTHDLEGFVREVTQEVVSLLRRQETIEAIHAPGVKQASAVNAEATDIRISWTDGAIARLRVSKSGEIERVVVENQHVRDEELERRILAAGTLDALNEKL